MICLRMRKTYTVKTLLGDFKVITLENPLLSKQVQQLIPIGLVKELQYLIPTYSWTLTLITNWTYFVVTNSYFQCMTPSMWLTNCANPSTRLQSPIREGCWLQNFFLHHSMKIMKLLGYKILWYIKHSNLLKRMKNYSKLGFRLRFSSYLCNCAIIQFL